MQPVQRLRTTALVLLLAGACGGEPQREEAPPRGLTAATSSIEPLPVSVSGDLRLGVCASVSGGTMGRDGLSGVTVLIEPRREIVALFDSSGALAYYRDQVVGRGGYTVRVDVAADSASVLDRTTRTVTSGAASEFRARQELGPLDTLVARALALCGPQGAAR